MKVKWLIRMTNLQHHHQSSSSSSFLLPQSGGGGYLSRSAWTIVSCLLNSISWCQIHDVASICCFCSPSLLSHLDSSILLVSAISATIAVCMSIKPLQKLINRKTDWVFYPVLDLFKEKLSKLHLRDLTTSSAA